MLADFFRRLFNPPARLLDTGRPGHSALLGRGRTKRERARAAARIFHGTHQGTVVKLNPDERRLPEYMVLVGEVNAIEYIPPENSARGGAVWRHEATDLGGGKRSKNRPLLVADPDTGLVAVVKHNSALRFDPERGLVG